MTMLKILCKLVSKQQSNSMLKKVKSLMRNASSYPLSNLCLDILIFIIKEAKFLIAEYLVDSFNENLVSGIYPDLLKIALVIPLHKGESTLELGSYTLLNQTSL